MISFEVIIFPLCVWEREGMRERYIERERERLRERERERERESEWGFKTPDIDDNDLTPSRRQERF